MCRQRLLLSWLLSDSACYSAAAARLQCGAFMLPQPEPAKTHVGEPPASVCQPATAMFRACWPPQGTARHSRGAGWQGRAGESSSTFPTVLPHPAPYRVQQKSHICGSCRKLVPQPVFSALCAEVPLVCGGGGSGAAATAADVSTGSAHWRASRDRGGDHDGAWCMRPSEVPLPRAPAHSHVLGAHRVMRFLSHIECRPSPLSYASCLHHRKGAGLAFRCLLRTDKDI